MKKNKKMQGQNGFTLIELLAVIVILAVIALIATPIIISVINKAEKGTFENTAYGILDAGKLYYTDKLGDSNSFGGKSFDFTGNIDDLKLSGGKPGGGALVLDSDGKQMLIIYDKGKRWCATKGADDEKIKIEDYDAQKCQYFISDNLVTNGNGEYGYNHNFSQFNFVKEGDKGYFTHTSSSRGEIRSDAFIPVNPDNTYTVSADLKSSNTAATYYVGIAEYDIDKKLVLDNNVRYINNTLTTLTKELKNGDTEVYVSDLTNFLNVSTTPTHQLGLIFWNYKDSTGYSYPELTYSRNVWSDLYTYDNIDKTDKKLKLKTAWTKGTIPVGTKLSQSSGYGDYNYLLKNGNTTALLSWVTYTGTISGVNTGPDQQHTKFREGTKYIKFLMLDNYNSTPSTTSSYRNISIKKQ